MRFEQAVEQARSAHEGATDQAGQPYLGHLLRVADAVSGDDAKLVAVLHDLLEDTTLTSGDLRQKGCPPEVLRAIEAMTRAPGEDYEDFVRRAAQNDLARQVKLADVADNADEQRLALLDEETAARLRRKYRRARAILLEAEGETVHD